MYKGMYQNFTLNLRSSKPSIENNEVEYSFDLPLAYECPRKESCLGGLDSTCKQGYEARFARFAALGITNDFRLVRSVHQSLGWEHS